ncbi:metallothionein-like protein type 3 [Hibiscus syriacus]|uniref:metallothionein-like protein type 3 n=1 Tax=Hibiscus syriacus TaxID=106335 RepID=UPI00192097FD|nr:metallothionein-like protein type 3 [Hibiscus syriacus]XP_039030444.1 metallothionein-like protein type 3 [Hibiscus syriacus]
MHSHAAKHSNPIAIYLITTSDSQKTFNMSDKCGNCDCSDKSQCVKKGNTMIIETEKSYIGTVATEVPAENDCKCGANCTCTNCTCGH